jgi:hypothetical protein
MLSSRAISIVAAAFCIATPVAFAQIPELPEGDPARTWKEADSIDGRWNQTDIGPFLASVLKTSGGDVAKGLSIRVGEKQQAAVAYDTATCSFRAAWTGGFLKFDPRRYGIVAAPAIDGEVILSPNAGGWIDSKTKYVGLHQQDGRVVLAWLIDGVKVYESPSLAVDKDHAALARSFQVADRDKPLRLALLSGDGVVFQAQNPEGVCISGWLKEGKSTTCGLHLQKEAKGVQMKFVDGTKLVLEIPPSDSAQEFTLFHPLRNEKNEELYALIGKASLASIGDVLAPGEPLWPAWLETGGQLGKGDGAYLIDIVNVPFDNPYKALIFASGVDFLSNGDIAVCTLHGDVWLVRGVDGDLSDVKWKRFATGLCQPLGLRVVDDKIYVLGKDQITRLHDRNRDDEADFYECFNNAGATSLGGHDFAACLDTDPAGNFYYIRAHEGVCRVSADGKEFRSLATGFRNPVGLGVGPDGMITAAPQEGEWTPSSCLIAVKDGGYYGFGGPRKTDARPLGYDAPLCWMPRSQDNSSGGQVWVPTDDWGLPKGQMLHLSYGLCTALVVLHEQVEDGHGGAVLQGGTVKLPWTFESGVMRGRFSPKDGQLYVCGMTGWQTTAAKDGCLQRVRYTGKPVNLPVALHVKPKGISITFNQPLDPKSANDSDNYFIEQWNYLYAAQYGSKEYKPSDPKKFGRDEVLVDAAILQDDGRTVYLELESIAPVMQMAITCQIQAADGAELKPTIYSTINAVPKK